jgi:elongation factor G
VIMRKLVIRMMREFKTSVNIGKPQVVHKEAIENESVATGEFDREVAGQRQYAKVSIKITPQPRGTGNSFKSQIHEDVIPEEFIAAIKKGVMESLESGAFMGYQVSDVKAVLIGGEHKDSLSSELAYTVCASMACKEALSKGNPYLLEPVMAVEIFLPESFTGDVMGDINARSGKIESVETNKGIKIIKASVPLSRMFGYSTSLRSASQGRGTFTMQFSHFDRSV